MIFSSPKLDEHSDTSELDRIGNFCLLKRIQLNYTDAVITVASTFSMVTGRRPASLAGEIGSKAVQYLCLIGLCNQFKCGSTLFSQRVYIRPYYFSRKCKPISGGDYSLLCEIQFQRLTFPCLNLINYYLSL